MHDARNDAFTPKRTLLQGTLRETFQHVVKHWRYHLPLAIALAIGLFALHWSEQLLEKLLVGPNGSAQFGSIQSFMIEVYHIVTYCFLISLYAILLHRYIILGEKAIKLPDMQRWRKFIGFSIVEYLFVNMPYALYSTILLSNTGIFTAPFGVIFYGLIFIWLIILVISIVVGVRMVSIFPHIATADEAATNIRWAFGLTKPYFMPILKRIIVISLLLLVFVFSVGFSLFQNAILETVDTGLFHTILVAAYFDCGVALQAMFAIVFASIIYVKIERETRSVIALNSMVPDEA